jgi:hypothetical protein
MMKSPFERERTARPKLLEPDRRQIEHFFDALFRHRGTEGFISFRSFYHDDNKPLLIEAVPVKAGTNIWLTSPMITRGAPPMK